MSREKYQKYRMLRRLAIITRKIAISWWVFQVTKIRHKRMASKLRKQLEKSSKASVVETDHRMENFLWFLMVTQKLARIWCYTAVACFIVLMGNNASCELVSIGIVRIKMFDWVVRTIGNYRHVRDLKRNIHSLSTLGSKEHKYTGECGVLKISRGALIAMKV